MMIDGRQICTLSGSMDFGDGFDGGISAFRHISGSLGHQCQASSEPGSPRNTGASIRTDDIPNNKQTSWLLHLQCPKYSRVAFPIIMAPDLNSLPPSRSSSGSPLQSRTLSSNPEPIQRQTPSPSPRSSSVSLAAAATINAGIQTQDSRRSSISSSRNNRPSPQAGRSERRRSTVAMNLNLNDPTTPGPGELQSGDHRSSMGYAYRTTSPQSIGGSPIIPHHQRAPSMGEIHQELEQEQEAQVVRYQTRFTMLIRSTDLFFYFRIVFYP